MNISNTLLDPYLVGSAASSGFLCLSVVLILMIRVPINVTRPRSLNPMREGPPLGAMGLLVAGRVGYLALFVRYCTTVLSRTGWINWTTFASDVVLISCDLGVIFAVLYAIRQTTHEACGNHALYLFATGALLVGIASFIWG